MAENTAVVNKNEVVTLLDAQFPMSRSYEYHIEGAEVTKVIEVDHFTGERQEMKHRKGKRVVHKDTKGKFIRLEAYKHYLKNEYMIGTYKFSAANTNEALTIAKEKMFEMGWRNLRLMEKKSDGWGVCKVIPSFETM